MFPSTDELLANCFSAKGPQVASGKSSGLDYRGKEKITEKCDGRILIKHTSSIVLGQECQVKYGTMDILIIAKTSLSHFDR